MITALAFGKYAAYVWPAYGLSFAGIGTAVLLVVRAHARARKALDEVEKEDAGR